MRHNDPGIATEPRDSIEAIPGIGIIRARTLRKAGFETVEALRGISVEDLTAVPGITEIKARQILDYVGGQRPAPEKVRRDGHRRVSTQPSVTVVDGPTAPSLTESIREFSSEAASLLSSDRASHFSGRLARQLGKIAALSGRVAEDIRVDPEDMGRFRTDLHKIHKLLSEVSFSEKLGRRTQEKLTDRLRDARKELEAIVDR